MAVASNDDLHSVAEQWQCRSARAQLQLHCVVLMIRYIVMQVLAHPADASAPAGDSPAGSQDSMRAQAGPASAPSRAMSDVAVASKPLPDAAAAAGASAAAAPVAAAPSHPSSGAASLSQPNTAAEPEADSAAKAGCAAEAEAGCAAEAALATEAEGDAAAEAPSLSLSPRRRDSPRADSPKDPQQDEPSPAAATSARRDEADSPQTPAKPPPLAGLTPFEMAAFDSPFSTRSVDSPAPSERAASGQLPAAAAAAAPAVSDATASAAADEPRHAVGAPRSNLRHMHDASASAPSKPLEAITASPKLVAASPGKTRLSATDAAAAVAPAAAESIPMPAAGGYKSPFEAVAELQPAFSLAPLEPRSQEEPSPAAAAPATAGRAGGSPSGADNSTESLAQRLDQQPWASKAGGKTASGASAASPSRLRPAAGSQSRQSSGGATGGISAVGSGLSGAPSPAFSLNSAASGVSSAASAAPSAVSSTRSAAVSDWPSARDSSADGGGSGSDAASADSAASSLSKRQLYERLADLKAAQLERLTSVRSDNERSADGRSGELGSGGARSGGAGGAGAGAKAGGGRSSRRSHDGGSRRSSKDGSSGGSACSNAAASAAGSARAGEGADADVALCVAIAGAAEDPVLEDSPRGADALAAAAATNATMRSSTDARRWLNPSSLNVIQEEGGTPTKQPGVGVAPPLQNPNGSNLGGGQGRLAARVCSEALVQGVQALQMNVAPIPVNPGGAADSTRRAT